MSIYYEGLRTSRIWIYDWPKQRWDRLGILPAKRTPTNRRYYTHEDYLAFRGQKSD